MLLEVEFEESSLVLSLDDKFRANVEGKLPFKTSLSLWKEEVYFQTPIEIDFSALKEHLIVERGKLYYWPVERGFCIFYGLSQPYSPVYEIGSYIGLLSKLISIEDGTEATVKLHEIYEPYTGIISTLEKLGFKAATPLHNGERVIEATGYVEGNRVSLKVYVEEYGVYIESEPLIPRNYCPENLKAIEILDRLIKRVGRRVRLDLSEDGIVTITSFVKKIDAELQNAVSEMTRVYNKALKNLRYIKYF